MAADIFLKIEGIAGESIDSKHKGEIEVESFSWGVSQAGTLATGGGSGTGKAQFQDFQFNTGASKASPGLFKACATGVHLKEAVLTVRKSGESPLDYYHIKLSDVLVSSYQSSGSNGTNPMESLSLGFAKIEFSFTTQSADGKPGETFTAGWDLKANKAV
jgi:type VI secretion system secreted protein Hcp